MTKHRSKEEWIKSIFQAAADEIEENGYGSFSMEAVVRRTELSKGGVYRFFNNRQDLAAQLFRSLYEPSLRFEIDECLAWNLSPTETIFRVLIRFNVDEKIARRTDRLWLQLIPDVLSDDQFRRIREEMIEQIAAKLLSLVERLAEREGLIVNDDFRKRAIDSLAMGIGLSEGFSVQSALGNSMEHLGQLTHKFVSSAVADLMSEGSTSKERQVR